LKHHDYFYNIKPVCQCPTIQSLPGTTQTVLELLNVHLSLINCILCVLFFSILGILLLDSCIYKNQVSDGTCSSIEYLILFTQHHCKCAMTFTVLYRNVRITVTCLFNLLHIDI